MVLLDSDGLSEQSLIIERRGAAQAEVWRRVLPGELLGYTRVVVIGDAVIASGPLSESVDIDGHTLTAKDEDDAEQSMFVLVLSLATGDTIDATVGVIADGVADVRESVALIGERAVVIGRY